MNSAVEPTPLATQRALNARLARHLTFTNPGWLIRRLIARDLRRVGPLASGRLVDVGSGEMPYRALFPNVHEYIGVDQISSYHPEARPALWADGGRLPLESGSCDAALATQVLEHVPEPAQLLREIARVLRPGGVLILTAPHIWELHEEPHDYFRFTRYGLAHLLTGAGFRIAEITAQGGFFVTAAQRASAFVYKICRRLRLKPAGIAAALVINGVGLALDSLYSYEPETLNYLAVARRDERADA